MGRRLEAACRSNPAPQPPSIPATPCKPTHRPCTASGPAPEPPAHLAAPPRHCAPAHRLQARPAAPQERQQAGGILSADLLMQRGGPGTGVGAEGSPGRLASSFERRAAQVWGGRRKGGWRRGNWCRHVTVALCGKQLPMGVARTPGAVALHQPCDAGNQVARNLVQQHSQQICRTRCAKKLDCAAAAARPCGGRVQAGIGWRGWGRPCTSCLQLQLPQWPPAKRGRCLHPLLKRERGSGVWQAAGALAAMPRMLAVDWRCWSAPHATRFHREGERRGRSVRSRATQPHPIRRGKWLAIPLLRPHRCP